LPVVAGSTLGILIANVPVVYFGERISKALPLRTIRLVSAAAFLALGVMAILKAAL
jgi:Ca2+/H+ antiporter, TMEM165/GDT1 family